MTQEIKARFWEYMTAAKGMDAVFRMTILAALDSTAPRPETEFSVVAVMAPDRGWRFEFDNGDEPFLTIFIPQDPKLAIIVTPIDRLVKAVEKVDVPGDSGG